MIACAGLNDNASVADMGLAQSAHVVRIERAEIETLADEIRVTHALLRTLRYVMDGVTTEREFVVFLDLLGAQKGELG
ncbi:hypothetical protein DPMN_142582 [Dreissena polymorpha]|uniref:Uncharacterized protein n=1 Tax=Dreissena polymorpha TaxID=45954 RepID=A0A9D4GFL6_DREPO|nr:hypothetical protein DPMN_142582 [Dreissena polymorpha]